jgi:hypothetical protein
MIKKLALAWSAGIAFVVVVAILGERGVLPQSTAASLVGFAAHDFGLYLTILLFSSLIYGALAFALLTVIRWLYAHKFSK